MGVVTVDSSLETLRRTYSKEEGLKNFLEYGFRQGRESYPSIYNDLEGDLFHDNYMAYLEICWANHYGAIFSPDILWYTLLCELASIVKDDTEKYRFLFTTSDEKETICVESNNLIIPMDLIIDALKTKVPSEVDIFLPKFSTSTLKSTTAQQAAFADLVSPYYSYGICITCGIPYVDIKGEEDDWNVIRDSWNKIGELLNSHEKYFNTVSELLDKIVENCINPTVDFWGDMFGIQRCGSGSDIVLGWFKELYLKKGEAVRDYPPHISDVEYFCVNNNKNYGMKQGVFFSIFQDEFLVPDFGCAIFEKGKRNG